MPRKRKGERADGLIQIQAEIGHYPDGRRKRKTFYGHTRLEAERKRDAFLARQNGLYRPDLLLSEWVDEYLSIYKSAVNSAYTASYEVPYNRLKKALGLRPVSSIRELDLQRFLSTLSGKSYSTVRAQLQALRRVFKKARKNGLITDDPAEDLILPAYTKGTHRALSRKEIDLILKYWNTPGNYAGLWVLLMLFCGLRRGEMMALDWSAVDMDAHTLTVRQVAVIASNQMIIEQRAKTEAGVRILPIPDYLYSALAAVPIKQGFVCLSPSGKPLTESVVSAGLKRFNSFINRMERGEPPVQRGRRNDKDPEPPPTFTVRYHDLRHTYCTFLYESGVDVKTAAYLLGHADISVTMKIYTHLSEQKKAASTAALTAYFEALKPASGSKMVVTDPPESLK